MTLSDILRELAEKVEELERKELERLEGIEKKVRLSTLEPGEVFKIGEHDFIVLEQTEGKTAVISKGFVGENVIFDDDTINYKTSNLKKVIEKTVQPIIEAAVGADNIVKHEVDLISVDMQNPYGTYKCKVRPITFDEARKFNDLLVNADLGSWWWTCTPWSTTERGWNYSVAIVSPSGRISYNSCNYNLGVRPFCILKSNIFVEKA